MSNEYILPSVVTTDIDTLHQTQEYLEKGMSEEGRNRFRNRVLKEKEIRNEASTVYGRRIVSSQCEKLSSAITNWIAVKDAKGGKGASRRGRTYAFLKPLEPDTTALICLKVLVNGISTSEKLTSLAKLIGQSISDEVSAQEVAKKNKQDYNVIKSVANKRGQYHRKYQTAKYMAGKREVVFSRWSPSDCILVGKTLIELVITELGLINIENIKTKSVRGWKTVTVVVPNESTLDWINDVCTKYEDLTPLYEPMVVPPLDYTTPFDGGYLTNHVKALPIIKSNSKDYLRRLEEVAMPKIYSAVNKIQAAPYKINSDMLSVLLELIESNVQVKGLPSTVYEEEPLKPLDIDSNQSARRSYAREKAKVFDENMKTKSQLTTLSLSLRTAQKYEGFEAIWIPVQLDFRGRIYCVPSLNYQGEDYVKSLLTFAEGKPLGTSGAKWLAIHLSNLWGNDKVRFEHREMWTHTNTRQILSYVEDPFTNRGWTEADKPFQFLAACFEWFGYKTEGESFVSHIGVALDGSCSGLQNFGMALRCEETGRSVNLVPSEEPSDIYQDVINNVKASMEEDLGVPFNDLSKEAAEELAKNRMRAFHAKKELSIPFEEFFSTATSTLFDDNAEKVKLEGAEKKARDIYMRTILPYHWLCFGMSRKTAKRSVMTYPYGSKQFGFADQIKEDTLKPAKKEADKQLEKCGITASEYFHLFPFFNGGFEASRYIAEKLWVSVRANVKKASEAMDWLQTVARIVSNSGTIVAWTTPLGLPVEQRYMKLKEKRIETTFLGQCKKRFNIYEETETVDARKQASSVSPNNIHSLDSTHLMWTVLDSAITRWMLVHDSYATLAADTEEMYLDVRKAFYDLYTEHDVLDEFYQQMLKLVPKSIQKEIPRPPSKGNLDLSLIHQARYSFA